jgi:hypothetical protein
MNVATGSYAGRLPIATGAGTLAGMTSILLTPLDAGNLVLKNRAVMAPLTRVRAGSSHVPNAASS